MPCGVVRLLEYLNASFHIAVASVSVTGYVIADNKLALNAGWDEEILAEELIRRARGSSRIQAASL